MLDAHFLVCGELALQPERELFHGRHIKRLPLLQTHVHVDVCVCWLCVCVDVRMSNNKKKKRRGGGSMRTVLSS